MCFLSMRRLLGFRGIMAFVFALALALPFRILGEMEGALDWLGAFDGFALWLTIEVGAEVGALDPLGALDG